MQITEYHLPRSSKHPTKQSSNHMFKLPLNNYLRLKYVSYELLTNTTYNSDKYFKCKQENQFKQTERLYMDLILTPAADP